MKGNPAWKKGVSWKSVRPPENTRVGSRRRPRATLMAIEALVINCFLKKILLPNDFDNASGAN
jgi:hypothetical protein